MTWDQFYNLFGIKDFIYYISAPEIQSALFPVKLVFIFFTIFFLIAVVYFFVNSSYLQYKFLEDVTEFFSWQSYGSREISKRWNRIEKRMETDSESEAKLAIIEADDFLAETLEDRGYEEKTFEESVKKAGRLMPADIEEIILAHQVRNSIVYDPGYKLDLEQAKKIMGVYKSAVFNVGVG